jgi:hypothetical protein
MPARQSRLRLEVRSRKPLSLHLGRVKSGHGPGDIAPIERHHSLSLRPSGDTDSMGLRGLLTYWGGLELKRLCCLRRGVAHAFTELAQPPNALVPTSLAQACSPPPDSVHPCEASHGCPIGIKLETLSERFAKALAPPWELSAEVSP